MPLLASMHRLVSDNGGPGLLNVDHKSVRRVVETDGILENTYLQISDFGNRRQAARFVVK